MLTSGNHWLCLVHKEAKIYDSTTGYRFWQFRTLAWKLYIQGRLLAERLYFVDDYQSFLKDVVEASLIAPTYRLVTRQHLFCLHIYSLWTQRFFLQISDGFIVVLSDMIFFFFFSFFLFFFFFFNNVNVLYLL